MSKCIKCGKSFLTRGRVKLIDADICFKCFDSLGFDHKVDIYIADSTYKWNDIKVGKEQYEINKEINHQRWLRDHPDDAEFFKTLHEIAEADEEFNESVDELSINS